MRLYVLPGACSLASHIALEAADAQGSEQARPRCGPDVVVVQRGRHREPEYLAVNPRGTVPALVTREGNLVVESLAVLLHIADQVPAAGLAPPIGDPRRDRLHGLLSFMVTTVHPAFQMLWRPERFVDSEEARADVRRTAEGRIAIMLGVLEEELDSRGRLSSDGFSIADATCSCSAVGASGSAGPRRPTRGSGASPKRRRPFPRPGARWSAKASR